MAYNIKDIAEELNISVSTVSRAINNSGRISEETKARVLAAAKKYNYTPNKVAQSLRQKKSKMVGLIVPDIGEYFSDVIKGVESVLSTYGYSLFLADSQEDPMKEANYIRLMNKSQVDGLVLATVSQSFGWINDYNENNTPVVFFDNEPDKSLKCKKVLLNNIKASEIAVNHLIAMGHTKIALICGNTEESTAFYRKEGFIEAMKKHNLEIDNSLIKEGKYYVDAGYTSMVELINSRDVHPFTAVIVSTYKMTCSAIHAIKDYGLKYPDDMSFVGFDVEDRERMLSPSLTSVLQPGVQIGRKIAETLLHMMDVEDGGDDLKDNDSDCDECVIINPMIKLGESTTICRE